MTKPIYFKSAQEHQRYYLEDGTYVPGVTTVWGLLDKPALKFWANKLGLEGVKVAEYTDKLAEIGTCTHYRVECDIYGEDADLSEYSQKQIGYSDNCMDSYYNWKSRHEIKVVHAERQLISEKLRTGGTIDAIAYVDGKLSVIDLKTGKAIYPEMEGQASVYAEIARDNGFEIENVWVLSIPRAKSDRFHDEEIPETDQVVYVEIFKHLRGVYDLKKKIGWK